MFINCFASGTNIQRLAKCTSTIDGVIYSAYSELEQNETDIVKRRFFNTNISALKQVVEESLKKEVMANWTKIWGKPYSNQTFIEQLFVSLVGGDTERPELNLSAMANEQVNCFMLFASANNKEMSQVAKIIQDSTNKTLSQYVVKVLNGEFTTNRDAEQETIRLINEAKMKVDGVSKKGVIIISNQMGSRSYSVPEIQATVFAFDRGSVDTTSQKGYRCLTPTTTKHKSFNDSDKEFGMIVDLSFDPNRNENIEKIIVDESIQLIRGGTCDNLMAATKFILSSANMFKINEFGIPVETTEDDVFKLYGDNEVLLRVADMAIDPGAVSDEILDILSDIKADGKKSNKKDSASSEAVTSVTINKSARSKSNSKDTDIAQKEDIINRACKAINASATSVYILAKGESYRECITYIMMNPVLNSEFKELFGVTANDVITIIDAGVLKNEPILDTIVQNSKQSVISLF